MKPENRAESEQSGDRQSQRELTRTEGPSNKAIELSDDEKVVINLLKAIKGLTRIKLDKVEKSNEDLFVSLV